MKLRHPLRPSWLVAVALTCAACGAGAAPVVMGYTVAPGALAPQPADTPLGKKLEAGHRAIALRDFAKADRLFQEAAALAPDSPQPALALAESARVRDDAAGARRWLQAARERAPEHVDVLRAWALWHYAAGEQDLAELHWQRALQADPRSTRVLVDLGDHHFNSRNDPATAAQYYQRALKINPDLGGAHYALGMVHLRAGELALAGARFQEAARVSPGNALPLAALADVQARQKNPTQALALYDQALGTQPGYYQARLDKAELLLALGRHEAALVEYRKVMRTSPNVAAGALGMAVTLHQLGRRHEALAAYTRALELDGGLTLALNNAAWLSAELGRPGEQGLAWARQAVAHAPGDPRLQGTLAWVLFKRGEAAQALAILEPLSRNAGRNRADTHYLLGVVYGATGARAQATTALREALRLDPSFPQAQDARLRLAG